MARSAESIDDIIASAVQRVTERILPQIQRAIEEAGARAAPAPRGAAAGRRGGRPRRRRAPEELTRWVADRRARRVPIFVIQMTGLDTKKKIVARYGEDAAFEKGKPAPAAKASDRGAGASRDSAARDVKARPPVVRKAASR